MSRRWMTFLLLSIVSAVQLAAAATKDHAQGSDQYQRLAGMRTLRSAPAAYAAGLSGVVLDADTRAPSIQAAVSAASWTSESRTSRRKIA